MYLFICDASASFLKLFQRKSKIHKIRFGIVLSKNSLNWRENSLSLLTLSKNCLDTVSLFNSFGKLQNVNVWILSCSLRHTVIMYASLKKEVNHLSSTLRALWGPYIYFVCESYLLERWCFHFTFTFIKKKPTRHTLLYGTPSRDPVTVSMSKMWMSGMSILSLLPFSTHMYAFIQIT